MSLSKADRAYFERIGVLKAASHAEAAEAHLARTLDARLLRSWELFRAHRESAPEGREDDPSPFYERADAWD